MQIIKNHVLFRATGEPNKNGHCYATDMSMEIPENIPLTIDYDQSNTVGHIRNAYFEDGKLIGDIVNEDPTINIVGINKFPGVCLRVENDTDDSIPVVHAKLVYIGIVNNNVDPEILPLTEATNEDE